MRRCGLDTSASRCSAAAFAAAADPSSSASAAASWCASALASSSARPTARDTWGRAGACIFKGRCAPAAVREQRAADGAGGGASARVPLRRTSSCSAGGRCALMTSHTSGGTAYCVPSSMSSCTSKSNSARGLLRGWEAAWRLTTSRKLIQHCTGPRRIGMGATRAPGARVRRRAPLALQCTPYQLAHSPPLPCS